MSGIKYTSDSTIFNLIKNTGGLNTTSSGLNVQDSESTDCENIDFNKFGSILKRNGYSQLNTTAPAYGGYDDYCKLLIHFDGTDEDADNITATTGQTVTTQGTAQLDTAQKVYGSASMLLDGDSDFLQVPDNANWNFGTGDFTIDCWVRFAGIAAIQCICGQYEDGNNVWRFFIDAANKLNLLFYDNSSYKGQYIMASAWAGLAVDTWYHVEVCRSSTTAYLFIDGVLQTLTETTAFGTNDVGDMAEDLKIGAFGADAAEDNFFNGWIDEFRISKGIARHTAAFTHQGMPYNNGTVNSWTGLHWFERSGNATKQLVGTCGQRILRMDDLDGTWDDVTSDVTITEGANYHTSFATVNEIVIGTNGTDLPWKLSSTGVASAADVPADLTTAKFVEHWSNYTFLANVTVTSLFSSRIYWSNIDSTSTWTASDNREVGYKDGQQITGIKGLGDRLVIYKSRSIWIAQFTGDSDIPFVFTKTPSHVGSESGYSIAEADNGHIFRSQDGYYYFDGLNSIKISDRVTTTLEDFSSSRAQYVVGCYQKTKNRYWAAETLDGGTEHRRVLTWDSFNNAFGLYTGDSDSDDDGTDDRFYSANCFAIAYSSGSELVYFGDYNGYVYQADTGSNDNPQGTETAIDAYYCTKWFNFNDLVDKKGIPHITIYYQIANSVVGFAYAYDFEETFNYANNVSFSTSSDAYGAGLYGTAKYAASGGKVDRIDLTGRGRVVRFRVSNANLDETMQVDGFGMQIHLETNA